MKSITVPLDEMISGSERLHSDLMDLVSNIQVGREVRGDITAVLCTLSVEHAHSMLYLISNGMPSSALALVRVQYEALIRAFWTFFAAPETLILKFITPLEPDATKEPDLFPTITVMLAAIRDKAPPNAVRALSEFKNAGWGAMNSYTHGSLRPIIGCRNGYPPELLSQVIQIANGAALFACMLIAQASNVGDTLLSIASLGQTHARVLPPHQR